MPAAEKPDARTIHERMVAILAELPAIGKDAKNTQQNFMYRSHDAVLNALNPLLAKHGVFVVPDVVRRETATRQTKSGTTMYEVNLQVGYTFYGLTGDSIKASAWGEGTDSGDKSTNKAMTMAFKNVIAQAFAVSTADTVDSDSESPEETVRQFDPETGLMPGGILPQDAAKALAQMEPTVEWPALLDDIDLEWRELKDDARRDFFRRLANAATWISNVAPAGTMPPTREQIQAGFAYAFSGTAVEVTYVEKLEPPEKTDAD
jgi:hypothetical protein